MSYPGIDYSLGRSNRNRETGIHYGVINQNSVNLDMWSEAEADYGDPHCPKCGNEIIASDDDSITNADWNDGKDYACKDCEECHWSEVCFPDEALGHSYESDGYKLTDCLDYDIFVLESPYYTFAQYCSPCVPGAGNLDTPCEDGPKTYALGHEWFDSGIAPYPVYSVKTGELIEAKDI